MPVTPATVIAALAKCYIAPIAGGDVPETRPAKGTIDTATRKFDPA